MVDGIKLSGDMYVTYVTGVTTVLKVGGTYTVAYVGGT